jgi:hypothetical protein
MDPTQKWFTVGAKVLGSYWVASVIALVPLVEDSHGVSATGMLFMLPMIGPVAVPEMIAHSLSGKHVTSELALGLTLFFVAFVICLVVAFRREISALRKKQVAGRS